MSTIANELDRLHELRAEFNAKHEAYQAAIEAAIPEEIRAQIALLDAEWGPISERMNWAISELEAEIKAAVLAEGATSRGQHLMAVYVNGRVSWDDKALNGYMVDHPELARFRNVGKPSVTIMGAS